MHNLITDLEGVAIGHAHDAALASGVTAVIFDEPTIASVDVRGGAPGTRDTDLLAPEKTRQTVDGIALSGGSLFGLDAVSGLVASLAEQGRGMVLGTARIPIVPGAIIFDLLNGGDKNWGRFPPYRDLGYAAASRASKEPFPLGTHGGGYGCTTADLKGGLGSTSGVSPTGHKVGAIVLVNAVGSATIHDTGHFWAASEEQAREFGGLGYPHPFPPPPKRPKMKGTRPENTTIAVVVTDATLTKAECRHLAVMAGWPRHRHPPHPYPTGRRYRLHRGHLPQAH